MKMDELNQLSAVATIAREKAIRDADNSGRPRPTEAKLVKIQERADALNVYGFDAKQRSDGTWISQSMPLGHNHYAALRRYEGEESYQRAVRKLWKENPARAKALSLPEPARAGA
jgi:hypothetical protein